MPEVISLLSSSPPPPLGNACPPSNPLRRSPRFATYSPGLSDFSLDLGLNFSPAPQSKKRKLTSPAALTEPLPRPRIESSVVFDLTSEPDFRPASPPSRSLLDDSIKTVECTIFDDEDFSLPTAGRPVTQPSRESATAAARIHILSDDTCDEIDPIIDSSQRDGKQRPLFSDTTANILAGLHMKSRRTQMRMKPGSSSSVITAHAKVTKGARVTKTTTNKLSDTIVDSSQNAQNVHNVEYTTSEDERTEAASKPTSRNKLNAREKEAQRAQKRVEKERRELEKQKAADLVEANKAKTNKKTAAPEMLLDMHSGLRGKAIGAQVEELMKELEVKTSYFDEEVDMVENGPISLGSMIKWRRRVEADYNEECDEWQPLSKMEIRTEKHVLVLLTAEEICTLAVTGLKSGDMSTTTSFSEETMKQNINDYVEILRQRCPNCTLILLIQGLTAFLKKNLNVKNREFVSTVRAQAAPSEPSTTTQRQKKRIQNPVPNLAFLTNDHLETLQLHLQLTHQPLQIQHTTSHHTTALQIMHFTTHLATRPYRLAQQAHNLKHASFCMSTNQIKTGRGDKTETWIQMLQEINRVTPSMAHGIVSAGYSGPAELVKAFKKAEAEDGRDTAKQMLMDVKKAMNIDGAWSDKRLGPMVSKRLWKVFMGKDETSMDGIA